jgi:hypothetical protein
MSKLIVLVIALLFSCTAEAQAEEKFETAVIEIRPERDRSITLTTRFVGHTPGVYLTRLRVPAQAIVEGVSGQGPHGYGFVETGGANDGSRSILIGARLPPSSPVTTRIRNALTLVETDRPYYRLELASVEPDVHPRHDGSSYGVHMVLARTIKIIRPEWSHEIVREDGPELRRDVGSATFELGESSSVVVHIPFQPRLSPRRVFELFAEHIVILLIVIGLIAQIAAASKGTRWAGRARLVLTICGGAGALLLYILFLRSISNAAFLENYAWAIALVVGICFGATLYNRLNDLLVIMRRREVPLPAS